MNIREPCGQVAVSRACPAFSACPLVLELTTQKYVFKIPACLQIQGVNFQTENDMSEFIAFLEKKIILKILKSYGRRGFHRLKKFTTCLNKEKEPREAGSLCSYRCTRI